MQTLENLETKFISATPIKNFTRLNAIQHQKLMSATKIKKLTQRQARQDIAVFAQMLINAYGGWPFFTKQLKFKILNGLNKIYKGIPLHIGNDELFALLSSVVEIIPDNHFWAMFGNNMSRSPRPPRINVGENLGRKYGNGRSYFIDKIDDIGIIAFTKCFAPDNDAHLEKFRKLVRNVMQDTRAIIIDMRDNGGGSPTIVGMIANELNGISCVPKSKIMSRRTTPQARALYKYLDLPYKHLDLSIDPTIQADNRKFRFPKSHKFPYDKPIYILQNNKSCSSAEHLQTLLRFYPKLKIVGSNSAGCRQYTEYLRLELKNSQIIANIPTCYVEVPGIKKFELNGHSPDIKCPDGTDAFAMAITDLDKHK